MGVGVDVGVGVGVEVGEGVGVRVGEGVGVGVGVGVGSGVGVGAKVGVGEGGCLGLQAEGRTIAEDTSTAAIARAAIFLLNPLAIITELSLHTPHYCYIILQSVKRRPRRSPRPVSCCTVLSPPDRGRPHGRR